MFGLYGHHLVLSHTDTGSTRTTAHQRLLRQSIHGTASIRVNEMKWTQQFPPNKNLTVNCSYLLRMFCMSVSSSYMRLTIHFRKLKRRTWLTVTSIFDPSHIFFQLLYKSLACIPCILLFGCQLHSVASLARHNWSLSKIKQWSRSPFNFTNKIASFHSLNNKNPSKTSTDPSSYIEQREWCQHIGSSIISLSRMRVLFSKDARIRNMLLFLI